MAIITGTSASQTHTGTSGDDTITGLGGNDTLTGAGGNDTFAYTARNFGLDTITDFSAGDRVDLSGIGVSDFAQLLPLMVQSGLDVVIESEFNGAVGGVNESITLKNVSLVNLTASSFIFSPTASGQTIAGSSNSDYLFGGLAGDNISGGSGADYIDGGQGNDYIDGGLGADRLIGGPGSDTFAFNARGFGSDVIADFAVGDKIDLGGLGISDITQLLPLMRQSGLDVVIESEFNGAVGGVNESITIKNVSLASLTTSSFIFSPTASGQTIVGSSNSDYLFGGLAGDNISGGSGADYIDGGQGNDYIDGGLGDDRLIGRSGSDTFAFNARGFGSDVIADFAVGDKIDLGGLGISDITQLLPLMRQSGLDVVIETESNGAVGGVNEIITINNVSLASLSASSFVFNATPSGQTIAGSSNSDYLFGGLAGDDISGGSGVDYIDGGQGNDNLTGGSGNDRFVSTGLAFGSDTIVDFTAGDKIDLSNQAIGDLGQLLPSMSQAGANTVITLNVGGATGTITILNRTVASFTAADFMFNPAVIHGGPGADNLQGGAGADQIVGLGGDDTLNGGGGSDLLDGGSGHDTAVYAGLSRQYAIGAGGLTVSGGPEGGVDSLVSIERLKFVDGYFVIGTDDTGGQVYRLYQAALGRAPDQSGLANWVHILDGGGALKTIADGFIGSQEFITRFGAGDNTAFVTLLYNNVLHRAPDAGGLQSWLAALNSGQSRSDVLIGFSQSDEFIGSTAPAVQHGLWVGDDHAAQVARLYDTMFSRLPDASGETNWTTALNGGTALTQVANGFVGSAEFQATYGNLNDSAFVTLLYSNVLHRAPDAVGLQNWVTALNSGHSRAEVVVGFSESSEHISNTAAHIDDGIWFG